jgi:multidrug efflux pump subunit AcrA (membrane-fusion protein)
MDELPGHTYKAKVTRYGGTLQNPENDRTMRVEVDLFNLQLDRWNDWEKAQKREELKNATLPELPDIQIKPGADPYRALMPGMYGKMRLVLRDFKDAYLLPSDAILSEGGNSYVYTIESGIAHRVEVAVDLDDGKHARVRLLERNGDKVKFLPLTGKEEIVYSNQGEISDGQAVDSAHVDWK